MATITLSTWDLPGALGPILVDLRTSAPHSELPVVVIHHGFKGFKDWALLPAFAERVAKAGFHAITLSVSGAGVDRNGNFAHLERFAENSYSRELDDLGVVLSALHGGELGVAPPPSVGMVGHSRGGGMALCLTREEPRIKAVATWAAISRVRRHDDATLKAWRARGSIDVLHARLRIRLPLNYSVVEDVLQHEHGRLDISQAAASLNRPWLLAHGTADETVPFAEAESLRAVAAPAMVTPLFLEGAGHTFGAIHPWSGPTPECARLFDATTSFFIAHLA